MGLILRPRRPLARHLSDLARPEAAKQVVLSPYPDVALSEKNYFDYVFEKVPQRNNMTSVVDALTGESWNFQQVKNKSVLFGRYVQ